tara:strand:- start:194766 stop:196745 length:1980 start_codon:yes stop_codon:yes gene_type:complete
VLTKNWLLPISGALALLVFFLTGTLDSVPGGDSAMFIGAAFSNGVAQPPGYPLITLIYKFLFSIPGDSVFYINFSSGFFNTAASLILYLLFEKLLECRWTAIVLACFFCVLPIVYRYGVVAEVFALNNFICSTIIYLTYSYSKDPKAKTIYLGAFFIGLGISNHHSVILVALPCVLYLIFYYKNLLSPTKLLKLTSFIILGLSPYLYLLIAPTYAGEISWGNTSTIEGFFHHFLRKDFGTFRLTASGKGGFLANIFEFSSNLPIESYAIFIVFPLYWIFYRLKAKTLKKIEFEELILLSFLFYIFFFFSLSNIDLANPLFKEVFIRFWQIPLLLLLIISSFGIKILSQKYSNFKKQIFFLLLLLVCIRGFYSFKESSRRGNSIIHDYGKIMLTSLPNKAVLFATGDLQVNILRYLQVVKKIRTDITILPIPLMDLSWFRQIHSKKSTGIELPPGLYSRIKKPGHYQMLDIIQLNPQEKYFILPDAGIVKSNQNADLSLLEIYKWVPHGFLFSLLPKREPVKAKDVIRNHNWAKGQFKPENYRPMEEGSWEELVYKVVYWNAERFHMIYHTRELKNNNNYQNKIFLANHIEGLRNKHSVIPPEFLKNLGLLYYQLIGKLPKAKTKLLSAWGEYYQHHADKSSKEANEIKRALDHFSGVSK